MSNPWPSMAPNVTDIPQAEANSNELKLGLAQALLAWDAAKQTLEAAKANEMEMRKRAFALGFGLDAKEGTNTVALANGYELKGVRKVNYNLKAPEGFKGDTVDAVDNCIDAFKSISNDGPFIADRLFKWKVDISITEYRKLLEESDFSPQKKLMLQELYKVLEIKDAAPTLEIKPPKGAK